MKKCFFLVVLIVLVSLETQAQNKSWTLRECADYAVSHNIGIKQHVHTREQCELQLSTSRNSRLPDLSASASESFSFGRGLTLDNTYTNRSTNSTSLSLGTSVPLFTGFQIPNQIKLDQLNLEAATHDLEKARNDIRMQVAQAYVQILYDMEIADVARRQIDIDSVQVARLQAFVSNGKASQAQLSQQQATLAKAHLTATQANNNLQLALLSLTQLLELSSPEGFTIVRPDIAATPDASMLALSPDLIYQEALAIKPEVQAEQLRLSASDRQILSFLHVSIIFTVGTHGVILHIDINGICPCQSRIRGELMENLEPPVQFPFFIGIQFLFARPAMIARSRCCNWIT